MHRLESSVEEEYLSPSIFYLFLLQNSLKLLCNPIDTSTSSLMVGCSIHIVILLWASIVSKYWVGSNIIYGFRVWTTSNIYKALRSPYETINVLFLPSKFKWITHLIKCKNIYVERAYIFLLTLDHQFKWRDLMKGRVYLFTRIHRPHITLRNDKVT